MYGACNTTSPTYGCSTMPLSCLCCCQPQACPTPSPATTMPMRCECCCRPCQTQCPATTMPMQCECCCQPCQTQCQTNTSQYGLAGCAGELVNAIIGITILQSILALIFGGFCGNINPVGPT